MNGAGDDHRVDTSAYKVDKVKIWEALVLLDFVRTISLDKYIKTKYDSVTHGEMHFIYQISDVSCEVLYDGVLKHSESIL